MADAAVTLAAALHGPVVREPAATLLLAQLVHQGGLFAPIANTLPLSDLVLVCTLEWPAAQKGQRTERTARSSAAEERNEVTGLELTHGVFHHSERGGLRGGEPDLYQSGEPDLSCLPQSSDWSCMLG